MSKAYDINAVADAARALGYSATVLYDAFSVIPKAVTTNLSRSASENPLVEWFSTGPKSVAVGLDSIKQAVAIIEAVEAELAEREKLPHGWKHNHSAQGMATLFESEEDGNGVATSFNIRPETRFTDLCEIRDVVAHLIAREKKESGNG